MFDRFLSIFGGRRSTVAAPILAPIEERSTPNLNNPSTSLSNPAAWLAIALGSSGSDAGISVTPESAVHYAPVWQSLNIIAGDVSKLPLHLYRRMPDGGRERDNQHPADYLIDGKANDEMVSGIYKKVVTTHAMVFGNGYGAIMRDGAARPTDLILLNPRETHLVRDNTTKQLWYLTTIAGEKRKLAPSDVHHVRGLGFDGLTGFGIIDLAKQSIGLGLGMEKYGATFFRNGARSSGVLQVPGKLGDKAAANLQETFAKAQAGLDNVGKTIVLEEGTKYTALTLKQDEAQFIESAKLSRDVIASFFGLGPHKLGSSDRTSYSSLEISQQEYLDGCLSNWLVAWQDECFDKLLTEQQKRQRTHYFEFNTAALLAADIKSRADVYSTGLQNGWITRNEVRRRENLPSAGPDGDRLTVQSNMQYLDQVGSVAPVADTQQDPDQPEQNSRLLDSLKAVLRETSGRMIRKLSGSVRRAAKKPDFSTQLDVVLDSYGPVFRSALVSLVDAMNSAGAKISIDDFVATHIAAARSSLVGASDLDQWGEQFETDEIERLLSKVGR